MAGNLRDAGTDWEARSGVSSPPTLVSPHAAAIRLTKVRPGHPRATARAIREVRLALAGRDDHETGADGDGDPDIDVDVDIDDGDSDGDGRTEIAFRLTVPIILVAREELD
jgi:hypothetical protein